YSLGVVGYRMITGALPFNGDSVHTILYKQIFEQAPRAKSLRPEVPEHLSAAIGRAMAKEPEQRFPTMEAFATAVWPEQRVGAAAPQHPPRREWTRSTSRTRCGHHRASPVPVPPPSAASP